MFKPVLKLKQKLPEEFAKLSEHQTDPKRTEEPRQLRAEAPLRIDAPEPAPAPVVRRSRQGGRRRFVIQKHAASHLHYDFRLESQDVLRSWSVPKGMPVTPNERRLAMATEDHPLDYLTFEGVIPEGQYGGGTVMVWDIGTYDRIEGNYWEGSLRVHLNGTKMKGEWLLERDPDQGERAWSLTKIGKGAKPASKAREVSALSGRTMADIAKDRDATSASSRAPSHGESQLEDERRESAARICRADAMQARAAAA